MTTHSTEQHTQRARLNCATEFDLCNFDQRRTGSSQSGGFPLWALNNTATHNLLDEGAES